MKQPQFGIKQTIRLEWVIHTAELYQQGLSAAEIRAQLAMLLEERRGTGNIGTRSENTRDFVITNLMRVWVTPTPQLQAFRNAACDLIKQCSKTETHAIHWGLMIATYPFWYHIARHTGRLLALQGKMTQKQLTLRLSEQYGETQTVSRYSQYVMRSFAAWEVVLDTNILGNYAAGPMIPIENPSITGFLYEAVLRADQASSKSFTALQHDPCFFPYAMSYTAPRLLEQSNSRITVQHFGGQDEIVILL